MIVCVYAKNIKIFILNIKVFVFQMNFKILTGMEIIIFIQRIELELN